MTFLIILRRTSMHLILLMFSIYMSLNILCLWILCSVKFNYSSNKAVYWCFFEIICLVTIWGFFCGHLLYFKRGRKLLIFLKFEPRWNQRAVLASVLYLVSLRCVYCTSASRLIIMLRPIVIGRSQLRTSGLNQWLNLKSVGESW